MKRRLLPLLSGALALALLAGCAGAPQGTSVPPSQAASSPAARESAQPGAPEASDPGGGAESAEGGVFSSFTSEDLEGNAVDQSIFSEHDLTMVNIWATFCGPCLKEMPELGEINEEYADQGFQVVGIVMDVLNRDGTYNDEQLDTAREAVEVTGASYPHLLPSPDLIEAKLKNVSAVPETLFVDKDGNQVGVFYLGARSKDDWTAIIDELLEQVK